MLFKSWAFLVYLQYLNRNITDLLKNNLIYIREKISLLSLHLKVAITELLFCLQMHLLFSFQSNSYHHFIYRW